MKTERRVNGAGQMLVTSFNRAHWARMAAAAKDAGLESVAKKFGAAACLRVGEFIPLAMYDSLQGDWRLWLVSGKFPVESQLAPVANDLITELSQALEGLLGQADLGEVDEETAPIVMRAKSALMRAERDESELVTRLRSLIAGMEWVLTAYRDIPTASTFRANLADAKATLASVEGSK